MTRYISLSVIVCHLVILRNSEQLIEFKNQPLFLCSLSLMFTLMDAHHTLLTFDHLYHLHLRKTAS